MRIALCPEGTRGDVQPLVAMGEDLLTKGHEVVLCAPPGFEGFAESRDIEFRPIGTSPKALLERHAKALIRRPGLRQTHAGLRGFREVLVNQFNHLPAATADVDKIIGSGSQMGRASPAPNSTSFPTNTSSSVPRCFARPRSHPSSPGARASVRGRIARSGSVTTWYRRRSSPALPTNSAKASPCRQCGTPTPPC